MGSRLLPLALAIGALLADSTGLHRLAFYLVLLAVVGAAAAACVGVGALLEGTGGIVRAVTTSLALALLVLGSAVRANAAVGGHVPTVAISAVVGAMLVYVLPVLGWLAEPLASRPARPPRPARPVRVPLA
jgi:hypothetical protein